MLRSDRPAWAAAALVLVLLIAGGGYAVRKAQVKHRVWAKAEALTAGDPEAGRSAVARYGCGGCHVIPGVPGASGSVGPSLSHIGGQVFIAGELQNTPDNLMLWIRSPRAVEPHTAMPDMGVTDRDARDIAAYLYTRD